MKRLSIRQALINAVELTDEGLSRYPNQMLKWAKYIEKEIGSANAYKFKTVAQTVTGCLFDLPADCYKVIGLFPGNHEDELNLQYKDMAGMRVQEDTIIGADVYGRDLSKLWIPEDTNFIPEMMWEEIGDQLNVVETYNNQEMTLVYQYIQTDDKGYWIVNESHIEAIAKYIVFKYAEKHKWKVLKSDVLLRQSNLIMISDLKKDYSHAVRNARATDGAETPFEKSQY